jgi:hypothetical protein
VPAVPPADGFPAWIADLTGEEIERLMPLLAPAEAEALDGHWQGWSHPGQRPPEICDDGTPWSTWVLMAGRGFGKTRAGAEWIVEAVAAAAASASPAISIALVGATLDEARRVMVEGRSGLLEVAGAWVRDWNPSLRRLTFRTGAAATLFSGASPEQLRGPEHHFAWCDPNPASEASTKSSPERGGGPPAGWWRGPGRGESRSPHPPPTPANPQTSRHYERLAMVARDRFS